MSVSSIDAKEDFQRFLNEDASRSYGIGPSYPGYVDTTIKFLKGTPIKLVREHRKKSAETILQMVSATAEREKVLHAGLKPHLRKLYTGKKFLLLKALLEQAVEADPKLRANRVQILSIIDKLLDGFTEVGEISPTGFWEQISEKSRRKLEKEKAEADLDRARRFPTRDHWASEQDLEEIWRQTQAMIDEGLWELGDIDDIGENGASIAFPVIQGDPPKCRVCIDKRLSNTQILVSEKMRLFHSRTACEIMLACLAKTERRPVFMQTRQDIRADVEQEKALRQKLLADMQTLAESQQIRTSPVVEDVDEETPFSFAPVSQKRDLVRFYYQNGARAPNMNGIFVAVPQRVLDEQQGQNPQEPNEPAAKRRRTTRKWILVFSKVAVFGSRSSVYECVHVSEALMAVLNGPLKLLRTLYIDDVHGMGRPQLQQEDSVLFDLFFSESGWWSSDSKRELQDFVRQKALTVLGMAYTVIRMVKIQVTVNPAKVAQLVRLGEELIKCIDNKKVKEKALLTYKGLFRHVAQLDRLKASQAKALDYWVGENFNKSIKKHNDRRQLRLSIETMNYAAKRVKPRWLTAEAASRPIAHLYTDASGEDFAELNRRLATGERTGFEGHAMFVGGFLALPSGEKKAFKLNVLDIPEGVTKMHIGVLEAVAGRLAIDYFKDDIKDYLTILHVDNLADVYVLTRNSSREQNTQRVSSQFHRVASEYDLDIFLTWVCTQRNVSDPLTRAARSLILSQLFPQLVPTTIPSELASSPALWGVNQTDDQPSSVV